MCPPLTLSYVQVIPERCDRLDFMEKLVSARIEAPVGGIIRYPHQVLETRRMFLLDFNNVMQLFR